MRFSGCSEFSKIDYRLITADGFKKFKLVESINGISCLCAVNQKTSASRILLWNPAINDCFVVPEPRFPISSAKCYCVGFGLNPLTSHFDDFKVVSITQYEDEGDDEKRSSSRAEIYSRITNSWKELVGWIPKWTSSNITGNQVIHEEYICWSPYNYMRYNVIVSFNLVSEEFHEMTLPYSFPSHDCFKGCITLLDGCVSLLTPYAGGYEVWTMKEFGNNESWIKLYNINLAPIVYVDGSMGQNCIMNRPLGFASTNEAVFWHRFYKSKYDSWGNDVVFCDTTSMADTAIWIRTGYRFKTKISLDSSLVDFCFKMYVESLIPVSYLSI